MRLFAIACPNGLGHFRRTIALVDRVVGRVPGVEVTLACAEWQVERSRGFAPLDRLKDRVSWAFGLTEPGVTWSRDPALYDDGRLLGWLDRLRELRPLREADLVLSDNLAGVLELRPDAVLLGSFLWSDVLDAAYKTDAVRAFVEHERACLHQHRPPMIAVEPMAMPGVRRRTQVIGVGFMTESAGLLPRRALASGPLRVALLGGATGQADALLASVEAELRGRAPLVELVAGFGFEPEDYATLDAVVARPGMGTITACIDAAVPMVLLDEGNNAELRHNAQQLAKLGGAIDLGSSPSPREVVRAVDEILQKNRRAGLQERLSVLPKNGLEEAANWVASKLRTSMTGEPNKRSGNGIEWLCVRKDARLSEVLRRFEGATERGLPAGIALVIDSGGKLEGTVTDGDVRRALLRHGSLEVSAIEAMHKDPIVFAESLSFQQIIRRLPLELERRGRRGRRFLGKIVLVHDDGRPSRVLDYHQLWEQRVATHRHVVVVGLGYVGLTLALELAEEGFHVTGVDVDRDKIAALERGDSYVHEQGLVELLREQLKGNFKPAATAPDDGDVFVIAVGTPVVADAKNPAGSPKPDLGVLLQSVEMIAPKLMPGALVVLRSTVPIGTTRDVVAPTLERLTGLRAGRDFHLAFAPERTVEGRALQELRELPQIIGGINTDSVEATAALFRELTPTMVRVESLEAAELAKLVNNAYRDLIFAFSNEIARISAHFNLDAVDVIRAANRGYPRDPVPLPSPGVGGPCLTKDPYILSDIPGRGTPDQTLSLHGRRVNESMHAFVADAVIEQLRVVGKDPAKATVLVCGLAFKGRPETGDLRNSTSVEIARLLKGRVGRLLGHDPVVPHHDIRGAGLEPVELPGALGEADAALFLNNHRFYEKLDPFRTSRALKAPGIVYDAWRMFRAEDVLHAGSTVYMGLGFVRYAAGVQVPGKRGV